MQGSGRCYACSIMKGSKTGAESKPGAHRESKEFMLGKRPSEELECGKTARERFGCGKRPGYEARKRALDAFVVFAYPSRGLKPMTESVERTYSQVAIAYYNANNPGAEIEFVEAGPVNLVQESKLCFHLNFKARPKNSDSPDPSPKLYFAEIQPRENENHVTTVCVVDPLDSGSTINGCGVCDPTEPIKYRIYHPKDGKWTVGRFMLWPLSLNQVYSVGPNPSTVQTPRESKEFVRCKRPWEELECGKSAREEFECGKRAREEFERGEVRFLGTVTPSKAVTRSKELPCGKRPWEGYEARQRALDAFVAFVYPSLGLKPMTESVERTYSQVAIAYYNANNPGAEIEFVEAGPVNLIQESKLCFHLNFKARPKNSDYPDPSPNLYFAEIQPRENENHVTTVCVVDPLDSGSTINGCGVCDPTDPIKYRIYHPKDGKWTAGRFMLWLLSLNQVYSVGPNPSTVQTPRESKEFILGKRPWEELECGKSAREEFECGKRPGYEARKRALDAFVAFAYPSLGLKPMTESVERTYSQVAIAYYNANNPGAEIEFVEAGPVNLVQESKLCFHLNFKARPKNSDSPDPSPKLYFAEIQPRENGNHVTTVCVVDPLDSGSTINGCGVCDPTEPIKYRIYHPMGGKRTAGRFMLRSRSF